jgi:hypothetical protein
MNAAAKSLLGIALSAFVFCGAANAYIIKKAQPPFTGVENPTPGSGTLNVSATVQGSVNFTFVTDPSGLAVTGTASTASLSFGTVGKWGGIVPANVTRTVHPASFDLSTPFDVRLDLANTVSTTYTLSAALAVADSLNAWTVDQTDISDGVSHDLTSTGRYSTAIPYTLKLSVSDSEMPASISNTIVFTAVVN